MIMSEIRYSAATWAPDYGAAKKTNRGRRNGVPGSGGSIPWRQLTTTGVAGPYSEHYVDLRDGQRTLRRGHRAQHLGIEFDLVQRNAVVDAQIEVLAHRVHLRSFPTPVVEATRLAQAGT